MRTSVVLIALFALQGLSDAVMVKNESAKLYPIFIFGLHIPLVFLFVVIVYIVSCYSERKRGASQVQQPQQVAPPPPPAVQPPINQVRPDPNRPNTPTLNRAVKVPPYWTDDYNTNEPVLFVPLSDFDMGPIKILVYSLWDPEQVGIGVDTKRIKDKYIHIRKVYRVQHKALYQRYLEFKFMMKKKENYISYFKDLEESLNRAPVQTTAIIQATPKLKHSYLEHDSVEHKYNEHYLFHGTRTAGAQSVCRTGLSTYFANGGLYGTGVYTAENPTKSDQYTDKSPKNNTLLLVRVCLGEIFVLRDETGADELKSAPCAHCCTFNCTIRNHKLAFDSVVTDVRNRRYREFVVYRDHRTYPEYIIDYDRVPDDAEMRQYLQKY